MLFVYKLPQSFHFKKATCIWRSYNVGRVKCHVNSHLFWGWSRCLSCCLSIPTPDVVPNVQMNTHVQSCDDVLNSVRDTLGDQTQIYFQYVREFVIYLNGTNKLTKHLTAHFNKREIFALIFIISSNESTNWDFAELWSLCFFFSFL